MTETFFCLGEMVHMTNVGCHELYIGWSKVAKKKGFSELAKKFSSRTKYGFGFAADGIDQDYIRGEFGDPKAKTQWLTVMDGFIDEVKNNGSIATNLDINWDAELKKYWLQKLGLFREALSAQIKL